MADSTAQESLLRTIPQELMDAINSGPRDIYEKIHQRELLLIEQIRHFANIRAEELANYSRNLLNQRQIEQQQRRKSTSQPQPPTTLKSIVKREPSLMEKRVSFSELPPEVEEFYSTNDDLYDSDDSDKRFDYNTIETSSDDEELKYSYVTKSSGARDEDASAETNACAGEDLDAGANSVLETNGGQNGSAADLAPAPASPPGTLAPSPDSSPAATATITDGVLKLDIESYHWSPSESEPVISFEDAYGDHPSDNEHETPEFIQEVTQEEVLTPPKPIGFVGSAPINIGMESLLGERIPTAQLELGGSPHVPASLNPENMSFSQRMAWEDRPRV